jgi:hypothetical protein
MDSAIWLADSTSLFPQHHVVPRSKETSQSPAWAPMKVMESIATTSTAILFLGFSNLDSRTQPNLETQKRYGQKFIVCFETNPFQNNKNNTDYFHYSYKFKTARKRVDG